MTIYTEIPTDKATTVEVRIRTGEYTSADSVYLCTAPLFMLESVIAEVKRWGVYVDNSDTAPFIYATGQFAITDQAFFEIVLHERDDG